MYYKIVAELQNALMLWLLNGLNFLYYIFFVLYAMHKQTLQYSCAYCLKEKHTHINSQNNILVLNNKKAKTTTNCIIKIENIFFLK